MTTMTKEKQKVTIDVQCMFCREFHHIEVFLEDYVEFLSPQRRHVQDIFPYLTADEKELLISRVCPKCWDAMFASDDNDDWDCEEDF